MSQKPSLFSLLVLMPFASICAVLFTPALPEIANYFEITDSAAGAAITVFLIGYALGNLPYGPIAKGYGRKAAIYLGIALTELGLVSILLSKPFTSWGLFLIGRFLSALGSTVGMKISFTMIGDAFQGAEAKKAVSLTTMSFAVGPGLAIALGGFLTGHYGWTSCFYALVLYGIFLFWIAFRLPETGTGKEEDLHWKKIALHYFHVLRNKTLVLCALLMGCGASIIYVFSTLAPFLAIEGMGVSPEIYGLWNIFPPLGMLVGCLMAYRLASRWSTRKAIVFGTSITVLAAFCMLVLFAVGWVKPWTLFVPMPFLYLGSAFTLNNASAIAMERIEDKSNGAAVMSFLNMGLATLSVIACGWIVSPAPLVIPAIFLFLAVCAFLLQLFLRSIKSVSP